jgi:hypothetical protein
LADLVVREERIIDLRVERGLGLALRKETEVDLDIQLPRSLRWGGDDVGRLPNVL